jgi:two-component system sensor histidine kinase AlgZ
MKSVEEKPWFPNFCRYQSVIAVMVVAELVVLVIALAPGHKPPDFVGYLGIVSFFAQWVAIFSAGLLCTLRPWLTRLPVITGLAMAYLIILLVCTIASAGAGWLDQTMHLGYTTNTGNISGLVAANVLICSLVAAAALRYFYVQQRWRQDVEARASAQVRALQARIRPHFLFNSMNTIASLIGSQPQVAEKTVEDLADLFRAALSGGAGDTTLGTELALCRQYLDIEQLRLGQRLELEWQVDALPLSEPLPSLSIQPLVENAVYHGIQPLPEGGVIQVKGFSDFRFWYLSISNPVASRSPVDPEKGNQMAVKNIRQRLDYRYDGRATMEIEHDQSEYRVTLKVPLGSKQTNTN